MLTTLWGVIVMVLGGHLLTLETFWEHFCWIFECFDPMGRQNEPKGSPGTDCNCSRSPKGGHFGCQKWCKMDKISTLEPTLFLYRVFHRNWMISALKKHDFLPEFSGEVPFWSISCKCMFCFANMSEIRRNMSSNIYENSSQSPLKTSPKRDANSEAGLGSGLKVWQGSLGVKSGRERRGFGRLG